LINKDFAALAAQHNNPLLTGGWPKSALFVPLLVDDKVKGIISIQDLDRENAFSDSDVRLLQTLANSMSVALENARLFDETQRLLKETERRAAELAILNGIGEAMTRTLDVKTITYNVGDKVREIFNAEISDILLYDPSTKLITLTYSYCERYFENEPPWVLGEGLTSKIIMTRQPLLLNTIQEMDEQGAAAYITAPTDVEDAQSYMGVPIMIGDKVLGVMDVQSYKPNAFNEDNVRLLSTMATSLGVALENAHLFSETQRLLKEAEERAAELVIINSVQEGLASKLEMQGIYDLVGDKIREIFDANTVVLATFDLDALADEFRVDFTPLLEERWGQLSWHPHNPRVGLDLGGGRRHLDA
jgi:GAF domain-containing protein